MSRKWLAYLFWAWNQGLWNQRKGSSPKRGWKASNRWKILRANWPDSCAIIKPGRTDRAGAGLRESLAFISLLIPAWAPPGRNRPLIGVSGISFWPVWVAGGLGAALGTGSLTVRLQIQGTGRADMAAVALSGKFCRAAKLF